MEVVVTGLASLDTGHLNIQRQFIPKDVLWSRDAPALGFASSGERWRSLTERDTHQGP